MSEGDWPCAQARGTVNSSSIYKVLEKQNDRKEIWKTSLSSVTSLPHQPHGSPLHLEPRLQDDGDFHYFGGLTVSPPILDSLKKSDGHGTSKMRGKEVRDVYVPAMMVKPGTPEFPVPHVPLTPWQT